MYRTESITLDSPEDRVMKLFELGRKKDGINSAWHDICRTDVYKKMFKIMFKSGNQDFQLSHSVNKYWSLFYGKSYKENNKELDSYNQRMTWLAFFSGASDLPKIAKKSWKQLPKKYQDDLLEY